MQITLNKKDDTFASIKIELGEADYKERVDSKIKDYSKKANIKGFRPGKVPPGMIKSMMGENFMAEEVSKLLNESLNGYIKENDLNIIGEPLPAEEGNDQNIDWKTQKEFNFTYDVGLIPTFKIEVSDKLKYDLYKIEIEDKTLEETIANLLTQNGASETPEEAAAGDFVTGKLTQDDYEVHCSLPTAEMKATEVKKFVGAKKEDKVTFDLVKAFNKDTQAIAKALGITDDEAKELKGEFTLEVNIISRNSEAELNQELFDKLFGKDTVKNEEEFNVKLKEVLAENYLKDADSFLFKTIQQDLLKKAKFDLSNEFVERWIKQTNPDITEENLKLDFDKYIAELKWSIIKNQLATDADIKVEGDEVRARASYTLNMQYFGGMQLDGEMATNFNQFVDKYLSDNNGKNYYQHFEQVLGDKLFEDIKGKVSLKDKKIKSEAFKKEAEKI